MGGEYIVLVRLRLIPKKAYLSSTFQTFTDNP